MEKTEFISIEQVSRSFQGRKVLDRVRLAVPEGETVAILGPSGCGKSTLLRALIGLVEPDEGRVLIQGREVTRASAPALRREIGYVIQEGGLFPHLTAERNLSLMPRILGWSKTRVEQRIEALASLTHFAGEGLGRYPSQLSGGQRQRVSLMRALMLDPKVLLMDEPLGALDPMIRRDLQQELREIFRRLRKTVVLVTHDLGEAAYLGDSIVLMRDGRIVQSGRFQDLLASPADPFVTRFINAQRGPLEATSP